MENKDLVNNIFNNIKEENLLQILENLVSKKIWYNDDVCLKINNSSVLVSGNNVEHDISFEDMLERISLISNSFLLSYPDYGIRVDELITDLENVCKE